MLQNCVAPDGFHSLPVQGWGLGLSSSRCLTALVFLSTSTAVAAAQGVKWPPLPNSYVTGKGQRKFHYLQRLLFAKQHQLVSLPSLTWPQAELQMLLVARLIFLS